MNVDCINNFPIAIICNFHTPIHFLCEADKTETVIGRDDLKIIKINTEKNYLKWKLILLFEYQWWNDYTDRWRNEVVDSEDTLELLSHEVASDEMVTA